VKLTASKRRKAKGEKSAFSLAPFLFLIKNLTIILKIQRIL